MSIRHAQPAARADILLHPGEWIVTGGPVMVRTLLGSCVAVTLWSAEHRIGGMCHYLLPTPHRPIGPREAGRYGTTVFARLLAALKTEGVDPTGCEAKLFGGSQALGPGLDGGSIGEQVGRRNIEIARTLLARHRIPLKAEDCAGYGHRTVQFELWSGNVWVRHSDVFRTR